MRTSGQKHDTPENASFPNLTTQHHEAILLPSPARGVASMLQTNISD
ncbi:hypothetical protein Y88_0491 [Novosphingobium nitrogenifigens DSM 19370]|uniref:Uncharacterized protein n=1 Tax=Novosphingobium nitrogenifigens DSM 19370 TaxID=983920 RepID=F1ZAF7_9SPHN|nr:hypothetical protein Y88_0491 [Novosphingobium nitrogenifigens DSM 19370]